MIIMIFYNLGQICISNHWYGENYLFAHLYNLIQIFDKFIDLFTQQMTTWQHLPCVVRFVCKHCVCKNRSTRSKNSYTITVYFLMSTILNFFVKSTKKDLHEESINYRKNTYSPYQLFIVGNLFWIVNI